MNSSVIVGILLVVLVLSLLFRWRQKSKENAPQPNHGYATAETAASTGDKQCSAISGAKGDGNGLEKIRQEDPSFDESLFKEHASAFFFQFQAAQTKRNISELRQQMTEEMFASLKAEEDKLAAEGKIHKIDNVSIHSVELTDAWQENGHDFIKVKYLTDFMDYYIEENAEDQACVTGEKIDYAKEWLFSRIRGKNPWYLSAIEPA